MNNQESRHNKEHKNEERRIDALEEELVDLTDDLDAWKMEFVESTRKVVDLKMADRKKEKKKERRAVNKESRLIGHVT
jgi:hypothetical protein